MAKRGTNVQRAQSEEERPSRWIREGIPVLIAKDLSDSKEPNPRPMATLEGEASRDIEELAKQIRRCCSDKKWTSYQKRVACDQLVKLALLSTNSVSRLAEEFPEPFREIAEESPHFPCLFPAHAEELPPPQKFMRNALKLGKRFPFRLRGARGRKTFSTKTWVNKFLIKHILWVHELAREEAERDPGCDYNSESDFRYVAEHVPLARDNAKQWLDVIWQLVLIEIPNPENHPPLRQLGRRPSIRTKRTRKLCGTVGEKSEPPRLNEPVEKRRVSEINSRLLFGVEPFRD